MIPNLNTLLDYKIRVIPGNSVGYGVPGQGAPADGGFFEVQKITFSDAGEDAESDLTDSTFTLEIGEQETEELPCNAGYHVVQDALRTLTNMGQAHVNRNDYSDYTLTTSHADIKIEWLVTFIHEIPSGSIDFKGFGNLNNLEIGTVAGFAASDFAIEEVQSGGVDRLDELPDQFVLLATQAPTAPTNVVLTVVSDDELGVSWSPPLHTGGEAIVQYLVEWDTEYTFDRPRVRIPFNENVIYSAVVNVATDPCSSSSRTWMRTTPTLCAYPRGMAKLAP